MKEAPVSPKSFDNIRYEVDGHKATITLNRPDALNALSPHMISELRTAYDESENDDNIWILIVTGTGRAFCTGADVAEIPEDGRVLYERPYLSTYDQWEAPQEGTPPFRRMAKPVLARNIALRMALMGKHERMSAQRAYDLGMISEVVEHDKLLERANEVADIVNTNAPLAVRGTRLAIHKTLDLPLHDAEILAETFRERVIRTEDALEGPKAFMEKRAPNWQCR